MLPLFLRTLTIAALLGGAVPVTRAEELPGATLTLPDGSILTLPRSQRRFAPSGPLVPPPDKGVTARPLRPAPPDPPLTAAERRRKRLDELFGRLAGAQDAAEATAITQNIDRLWAQSGSATADLLMQRAVQCIAAKDNKTADLLLDKIVVLRPGWAEAWNKRATVRYLDDDDRGSMEDIAHVLALEPRHFGALSGMGFILHRNGDDKAALAVLRKAAAINPQQPDIKALIEQLTPEVEGIPL